MITTNKFSPCSEATALRAGLVLRVSTDVFWRITHVFETCVYVVPVSTPNMANYAVRPAARARGEVTSKIGEGAWTLGRLPMPQEFLSGGAADERVSQLVESHFALIQPLVDQFEVENNLGRNQFNSLINRRADELDVSPVTVRKILLRYYYFGKLKQALRPLRKGLAIRSASPEAAATVKTSTALPKRRGPKAIETKILGPNDFVVSEDDVLEMVACFEDIATKGKTTQTAAHREYLSTYFAERHPLKYADYLAKKCPLPVTLRQYRWLTKGYASLTKDSAKNVSGHAKRLAKGSLAATGPGEIYEIDATGGRIFLVDSKPPHETLGTPLIYLIIDRWSRFVVSVYVTLRPASWEEIRFALLVAFTSRKRRFTNLGVNVDEERWPVGRVPARLVMDRGSEMISQAMLQAAVSELQIETETLPPYCPDGKAIIERLNRELKRKMSERKIHGVFAERPTDVRTKRTFKAAKAAAAHSLREIYWSLIDVVDEHNNRPHASLSSRSILRLARVTPTPRHAYLWGLKNITGIESPPFDDADYIRLLLGNDKATIANGSVMYRGRRYRPMNAAAERQARLSSSNRRSIIVKVDRSDPVELYCPNGDSEWPRWQVDAAGLQELQEITFEEEDHLRERHRLLIAEANNDALIEAQRKSNTPVRRPTALRDESSAGSAPSKADRREAQTQEIKRDLLNSGESKPRLAGTPSIPTPSASARTQLTWKAIEEMERLETIERQRKGERE